MELWAALPAIIVEKSPLRSMLKGLFFCQIEKGIPIRIPVI